MGYTLYSNNKGKVELEVYLDTYKGGWRWSEFYYYNNTCIGNYEFTTPNNLWFTPKYEPPLTIFEAVFFITNFI